MPRLELRSSIAGVTGCRKRDASGFLTLEVSLTAATTSGAVSSATSSQAQGSANIMCIGAGAPVSLFSTGSGSAGFQAKTSGQLACHRPGRTSIGFACA